MNCNVQEQITSILSSHPRLASVQALLENVWELLTRVIDGRSSSRSFAGLDQDGCWRKMYQGYYQLMLDGSLEEYSENWTRWGMMLDGVCMELPMLEQSTKEKGLGLWPTATALDCAKEKMKSTQQKQVSGNAERWTTPSAADARGSHGGGQTRSLRTDTCNEDGLLNPAWVACLMGYSPDWLGSDGQQKKDKNNMNGNLHAL